MWSATKKCERNDGSAAIFNFLLLHRNSGLAKKTILIIPLIENFRTSYDKLCLDNHFLIWDFYLDILKDAILESSEAV